MKEKCNPMVAYACMQPFSTLEYSYDSGFIRMYAFRSLNVQGIICLSDTISLASIAILVVFGQKPMAYMCQSWDGW